MIEPARIQAVIEIVDNVAASLANDGPSADVLIRKYFSSRRYAGSRDRRAVTDRVYQVIRNWGFLHETSGGSVRKMVMLSLLAEMDITGIEALFSGHDHAPAHLSDEERNFLGGDHEIQSHHRLNYPQWLDDRLKARFPSHFEAELESLNGRAPFELRVNQGKTTCEKVAAILTGKEVEFTKGRWAKTALVLPENPRITEWDIYQAGLVEIQDEAAQLAVELCDIHPGQQVMDLCAGAGGKTLAIAALMENKGQVYAFDNNARRLKDLKPRAKRADARILQAHEIDTAGGKRTKILSEHLLRMDRVILDVPCSGSGVWRRNPEAKWRLSEEKLEQYGRIQKNLLTEGWGFVKPGGRLIYMTCSLFQQENEQQISSFMADQDKARLVSYRTINTPIDGGNELKSLSSIPECLALSPFSHGTDGFFVAILEKSA